METTRYSCWVLLSSLLLLLTGCSRREMLDDYPVSGVQITLDWSGVSGEIPDEVRVIFYPKNAGGVKFDKYLPAKGGNIKVIPGRYSMVIYNYNTETNQVRGDDSFETIEIFTGNCHGLGLPGTEQMVWEPDPLYIVSERDVKIEKSDEEIELVYKPELAVRTYSFQMKVAGLQYVKGIVGSVEGMANCLNLGTGERCNQGCPVYFEIHKTEEGISGSFRVFGVPTEGNTRAELQMMLKLGFVKVDNTVQTQEVNITEAIMAAEGGQGGGGEVGKEPEFNLPLDDQDVVEVEKPTNPPVGGDGGFGGDVGDWGEDDEVEL